MGEDRALKTASEVGDDAVEGEPYMPYRIPGTVKLLGEDGPTLGVCRALNALFPPLSVDDAVRREVDERRLPMWLERSFS